MTVTSSDTQRAAAAMAERVAPAVVRIGRGWGRGAGIVVAEGTVVTNAHSLRGSEVTVHFADGLTAVGTVAGVDADGDLAVVSVDTGATSPLPFDPAAKAVLGSVVATAVAMAGGGWRLTFGTVSGTERAFRGPRGRLVTGALEHTAPMGRGSSGSPVLDLEGHLVAINTHRLDGGFYLALPADAALQERCSALARGESPRSVRLGIAVVPPHAARRLRAAVGLAERAGVLVRAVEEHGPAARAGVVRGDLVVSVAGRPVASVDDLLGALEGREDAAGLELTVLRGSDEIRLQVPAGGVAAEGSA